MIDMDVNDVIVEKMGIVSYVIKNDFPHAYIDIPIEDIYQTGYLALVEAVNKFNVDISDNINTYIARIVHNAIARYINKNRFLVCVGERQQHKIFSLPEDERDKELLKLKSLSNSSYFNPDDEDEPFSVEHVGDERVNVERDAINGIVIREIKEACSEREFRYITMAYNGLNHSEIAKSDGVSNSMVTKVFNRIRKKCEQIA